MGALLRRQWLLGAGVVADTTSGLFRFPVLEASATPEPNMNVRVAGGSAIVNINIGRCVINRFMISVLI